MDRHTFMSLFVKVIRLAFLRHFLLQELREDES